MFMMEDTEYMEGVIIAAITNKTAKAIKRPVFLPFRIFLNNEFFWFFTI